VECGLCEISIGRRSRPRGWRVMTERERVCLKFLSDKMGATAHDIGVTILAEVRGPGSNYSAIASNVVGALRRRGLVAYLPDLKMWRITEAGRAAGAK
jgi:hypothetical protein